MRDRKRARERERVKNNDIQRKKKRGGKKCYEIIGERNKEPERERERRTERERGQ